MVGVTYDTNTTSNLSGYHVTLTSKYLVMRGVSRLIREGGGFKKK